MAISAGPAEASAEAPGAQLLTLARSFLDGADPRAVLQARNAAVDESFAKTGSYPFQIANLAGAGSAAFLATDKGASSPDTLTLVPAQGVWLKLDAVIDRFGEAKSGPALPGAARRYRIQIDEDRSIVVELSGDPIGTSARVVKLVAIRER